MLAPYQLFFLVIVLPLAGLAAPVTKNHLYRVIGHAPAAHSSPTSYDFYGRHYGSHLAFRLAPLRTCSQRVEYKTFRNEH